MKNHIILFLLCTAFTFQTVAQSPTLVQDYLPGQEGSIDGWIRPFQGKLLYKGYNQNGDKAILQYDPESGQFNTLLLNDDVDGIISGFIVGEDRITVTSNDVGPAGSIYISTTSDLSDLTRVYNSGDAQISKLILRKSGYTVIIEFILDNTTHTTNIKVIDPDLNVNTVFQGLEIPHHDLQLTTTPEHLIIAAKSELINNQAVIAYHFESNDFVPFIDVVSNYEDCGTLSQLSTFSNRIISYGCDQISHFDLLGNTALNLPEGFEYFTYVTDSLLYYVQDNSLIKLDRMTNTTEIIIENLIAIRGYRSDVIAYFSVGDDTKITHFNYESGVHYTYETSFNPDQNIGISLLAMVPSGIHISTYELDEGYSILTRINKDSNHFIDVIEDLGVTTWPVDLGEDIYFSFDHPDFGKELFVIDYEKTSIEPYFIQPEIHIYPNPSSDYLRLLSPSGVLISDIHVIDHEGKILKTFKNQEELDIRFLKSGLHYLNIYNQERLQNTIPFVKI